jgi:hypothetical protein
MDLYIHYPIYIHGICLISQAQGQTCIKKPVNEGFQVTSRNSTTIHAHHSKYWQEYGINIIISLGDVECEM